jgi:hypothetical protein
MKTKHPALCGFLQALGVMAYIGLISVILTFLDLGGSGAPEVLIGMIVLTLFVFSAAATGALVLIYPSFLAIKLRFKSGLLVFFYTLLFLLIFALAGIVGTIILW